MIFWSTRPPAHTLSSLLSCRDTFKYHTLKIKPGALMIETSIQASKLASQTRNEQATRHSISWFCGHSIAVASHDSLSKRVAKKTCIHTYHGPRPSPRKTSHYSESRCLFNMHRSTVAARMVVSILANTPTGIEELSTPFLLLLFNCKFLRISYQPFLITTVWRGSMFRQNDPTHTATT